MKTPLELMPCAPVGDEFGSPVSPAMLAETQRDFPEVVGEVAEAVQASHVRHPEDIETGEAAGRAIKALGCTACELEQVCAVSTNLDEAKERGAVYADLASKASMVAAAPPWLTEARLAASGMSEAQLREMAATPQRTLQAINSGELNIETFLAGVQNAPAAPHRVEDLPELEGIQIPSKAEALNTHTVSVGGNTFTVVDASDGQPHGLQREERGVLLSKLLNRMGENSPDGRPQVFHPDNTMQKALRGFHGRVHEIRMSGKNRIYFTVTSQEGENRIVLLGGHGGEVKNQDRFINSLSRTDSEVPI